MTHRGHLPPFLGGKLTLRITKSLDQLRQQEVQKLKLEARPPLLWVPLGNSGCPRSHLRGGLSKTRATHLQAEAPGREGGDAAGQDWAPEWGFALLVLIRTQPARLVLLPCSKRKEVGGAGQRPRTKRTVRGPESPGSHRGPQRPGPHAHGPSQPLPQPHACPVR